MAMSCNSILKALFDRMVEKKLSVHSVEERAGVGAHVIRRWRFKSEPLLGNAIAALNAVGLDLVVTTLPMKGDQLELFNNKTKETTNGTVTSDQENIRLRDAATQDVHP